MRLHAECTGIMWKLEFFHLLTHQNYEENQQKLGTFSKNKVVRKSKIS